MIRALFHRTLHALRHLNLFASTPPTTDLHKLKTQIISTRLFIIALTASFTILVVYTSAITITKTITVPSPTLDRYSQLYATYSQSLICPCTKISQTYQHFIDLNFTLHPVCSSSFITDAWITGLSNSWSTSPVSTTDFRVAATFQFQALKSFCELANETIHNSLSRFFATEYVTMDATPLAFFTAQTGTFIDQFIATTVKNFVLSFRIIRNIIQEAGLLTGAQRNAFLVVYQSAISVYTYWWWYGECGCARSSRCHEPLAVYNSTSGQVIYSVPGFETGCYTVESLLQSSLECLYNRTCFDDLSFYAGLSGSSNMTLIDGSMLSRFSETSSVGELLDEMMVDRWNRSAVYERYYAGCRPKECAYTVRARNDVIYIVTTVFGLIGGLSTVLKILVPPTVRVVYHLYKTNRKVDPSTLTATAGVSNENEDIRVEDL